MGSLWARVRNDDWSLRYRLLGRPTSVEEFADALDDDVERVVVGTYETRRTYCLAAPMDEEVLDYVEAHPYRSVLRNKAYMERVDPAETLGEVQEAWGDVFTDHGYEAYCQHV